MTRTLEGRRQSAITEWKDEKGADATYKALINALSEIECGADAEFVCQLIQPAALVDCTTVNSSISTKTTSVAAVTSTQLMSTTTHSTKESEHTALSSPSPSASEKKAGMSLCVHKKGHI